MQKLWNSTVILHHCSRVPGKGLPVFAAVVDSSWRKHPRLSSDAQEIRELQELWPLPSPKLWDCCFNPQRLQEPSPIATAQGYKLQAVGLHLLIPWLLPALHKSRIVTLTCKVLPLTLSCMGASGDGGLQRTVPTLPLSAPVSALFGKKKGSLLGDKLLLTPMLAGPRGPCLWFCFFLFAFFVGFFFLLLPLCGLYIKTQ